MIIRRLVLGILIATAAALFASSWTPYHEESALRESGLSVQATVLSAENVAQDDSDEVKLKLHYEVDGVPYEPIERIPRALYDGSGAIEVVYDPAAPKVHRVTGTQGVSLGMLIAKMAGAVVLVVLALAFLILPYLRRRAE